jgi:hypothetical protein
LLQTKDLTEKHIRGITLKNIIFRAEVSIFFFDLIRFKCYHATLKLSNRPAEEAKIADVRFAFAGRIFFVRFGREPI